MEKVKSTYGYEICSECPKNNEVDIDQHALNDFKKMIADEVIKITGFTLEDDKYDEDVRLNSCKYKKLSTKFYIMTEDEGSDFFAMLQSWKRNFSTNPFIQNIVSDIKKLLQWQQ